MILLNKVFSGSHLVHHLGHEIINFIVADDGNNYVYINPLGKRCKENIEYVFHIIKMKEKDKYEVVAVSEIDHSKDGLGYYKKGTPTIGCPTFMGHAFYDIFACGSKSNMTHWATHVAKKFYRPKDGLRIFINVKETESSLDEVKTPIELNLKCNPQHSVCYATFEDEVLLKDLIIDDKIFEESKPSLNLASIPDEFCYAIISKRTNLEVSTSNLIAYFLGRDDDLLYKFLHDFLGVKTVTPTEKFEIEREENDIDLLFKSQNHVIVVENKIDSNINGVDKTKEQPYPSQLSKYYDYINKKYASVPNKEFFILHPEYNNTDLSVFLNGSDYIKKTYTDLYNVINTHRYLSTKGSYTPTSKSLFLFEEFIESIYYLTFTPARQMEYIQYIKLKQRINDLDLMRKIIVPTASSK